MCYKACKEVNICGIIMILQVDARDWSDIVIMRLAFTFGFVELFEELPFDKMPCRFLLEIHFILFDSI